eukprot:6174101-Pleurochrysis_carterae.AAC.2
MKSKIEAAMDALAQAQAELKAEEKSLLNVEAMKKAADNDEARWRVGGENVDVARKKREREEKEQVARKQVQSGHDNEANNASVRIAAKVCKNALCEDSSGSLEMAGRIQLSWCRSADRALNTLRMVEDHAASEVRVREDAASSFRVEAEGAAYDAATAAGKLAAAKRRRLKLGAKGGKFQLRLEVEKSKLVEAAQIATSQADRAQAQVEEAQRQLQVVQDCRALAEKELQQAASAAAAAGRAPAASAPALAPALAPAAALTPAVAAEAEEAPATAETENSKSKPRRQARGAKRRWSHWQEG